MPRQKEPFWFGDWAWDCGPGFAAFGRRSGRRARGFRARVFDRGDLKYAILRLLREKAMHGYEVMQALAEESGGWYSPSAGTVYPALQMLQDQGYVESEERDGKRVYRITDAGRAFLERHSERADDVMGRVSEFAERFSGRDMGDLTKTFVRFAQASWEEAFRAAGDEKRMAELKEILERGIREMRKRGSGGGEAGSPA